MIERDAATGIVTFEAWHKNGVPYRDDGPVFTERDATTGAVTFEEWWKDGKRLPSAAKLAPTPQP